MTGPGWGERVFTFYDVEGATALRDGAAATSTGGRLVVNVVDMPIKCPVAPLEFCFLADWYFARARHPRRRRADASSRRSTAAFTKPVASSDLGGLLAEKDVELMTEFATGEVDGAAGVLTSWDEREVPFDLLVTIPLHGGAAFVERSPGPRRRARVRARRPAHAAEPRRAERVRHRRRGRTLPTSKAGSVTHFEGETLVDERRALPRGRGARGDASTGTRTASSRPASARRC